MTLNINGVEHDVRFGIRFVAELDKKYANSKNEGYGVGLAYAVPLLLDGDALTLADVLHLSCCTEKNAPSKDQVDSYVESVEDIEALFGEVLEELKKQNATKIKTVKMIALYEETQKANIEKKANK